MSWRFDEYQAVMVSTGLITEPHYKAMSESLWVYLWLLNRVTNEDGVVAGGALVTMAEIGDHFGTHRVTIKRALDKLEKLGYIDVTRVKNKGFKVKVTRAKLTRRERVHERTSSSDTSAPAGHNSNARPASGGAHVRRDISVASKSLLSCSRTSNKTGNGAPTHPAPNAPRTGATMTFDANDPAYLKGLDLMKKARDNRLRKGQPVDAGPLYGLPGTEDDPTPSGDGESPPAEDQDAGETTLHLPDPEPMPEPEVVSLPEPSEPFEPTPPTAVTPATPQIASSGDLAALRALADDWETILSPEEMDTATLRLDQLEALGLTVKVGVTEGAKARLGVTPAEKLTEPLRAWIVTHREALIAAWVVRSIQANVGPSELPVEVMRGPDSP